MKSLVILSTAALLAAPGRMACQIPVTTADSVAPRTRPDASRLDPVVLTYIATIRQATDSARSLGERSVAYSKTTYAGQQAWEIVETHGAGANASVDTVVSEFTTLSPLHWGATQQMPTSGTLAAAARVSVEIHADTMIGVLSAPTGRRTIVAPIPVGSLLTAGHTEGVLRSLPIAAGWRDSAWVVITDLAKTTVVPASFAVSGDAQLLTTAGTFDCWMITLATDVGRTQYWVSKADRIVVKSSQTIPESGDVLEYTLTRISH